MTKAIRVRQKRRSRGWDEGATAVEAAFGLSLLLLLIFGIIEFAQIIWTWNTMVLAIQQAARYAMVHNPTQNPDFTAPTCVSATAPQSCPSMANCAVDQANQALSSYPASNSISVSVTGCTAAASPPDPTNPATMTIQGSFTFDFILSTLFPYGPITLTSQATVPLE
jgi:Flp pilus assembly protein TadG